MDGQVKYVVGRPNVEDSNVIAASIIDALIWLARLSRDYGLKDAVKGIGSVEGSHSARYIVLYGRLSIWCETANVERNTDMAAVKAKVAWRP